MAKKDEIIVKGAREHNLKSININIPRDKFIVITGLSGSGKSSLAFDTIYAEGQRRYVESLSAYARQFLDIMHKPDVDHISGLSPAISIEQKTTSKNPRSTVGTVTEIYDYLRLLFARVGTPFSPETGLPIRAQQPSDMVDQIMELKQEERIFLLAPIVRDRKGEYRKELAELQKKGFQRVKIDGHFYEFEEVPTLKKNIRHHIEVVVDRLIIKQGIESRLVDSLRTALDLADGIAVVEILTESENSRIVFSENFSCPISGFTIAEIEPRLFSFNAPTGACKKCDGLGIESFFDESLIVPNESLSLSEGALSPWARKQSPYIEQTLISLADAYDFSTNTPWKDLKDEIKNLFFNGSNGQKISFKYDENGRTYEVNKTFEGIIPNLERRYRETGSSWIREEFERYQNNRECISCKGYRLNAEALAVKVAGMNIGQMVRLSVKELFAKFEEIAETLSEQNRKVGYPIIKEIKERLNFLNDVGLDYLTLNRTSGTLSGGESQRIRLASQIGSGLTGVLYVLDEPSIGLHQRDNARLLSTLKNLRDQGNTVIVVEHDQEAMLEADHLIDIGPGAGIHGGRVVAAGTPNEIKCCEDSKTGKYLSGAMNIDIPLVRRKGNGLFLEILGAAGNNLKNVDACFPLGCFTCVTGVSGGGKSTLVIETLFKTVAQNLSSSRSNPAKCKEIKGVEFLDKVIDINQSPIGRTPRSNPATYTGAFSPIREWFSGLPEARVRGYNPGRFSFNVKGGRCEACKGDGLIKIEMHFLPDVYVMCESCKGKRYNRETLEIKFKGKNISDVLNLTVQEAGDFFSAVPTIREKMKTLMNVGLGYIKVGQSATTLSGGEAQRVKLSKELSRRSTGKTLYILDEPTTGLHFEDVKNLLNVLHKLVDQGNSVIVIEHNLDVVKTADFIIDIGPEGGDSGGKVIAQGSPEEVAKIKESFTGAFLKRILFENSVGY
ncbi:MAG: excinuclease ABC subunit A [Rhodobacteraceae bacterium]|nr:MAG: excinuclease ABC subunit A [Paracoccaceae bacterium]